MQLWKPIEGYEGLYEVSNRGHIKSLNYNHTGKPRLLKTVSKTNRYQSVTLTNNGNRKNHRVHRLVAKTFIPNKSGKEHINHIDGDRNNNSVENLEWCTPSENMKHAIENNLLIPNTKNMIKERAKTNGTKVKQLDKLGNILGVFGSMAQAERETGASHISCVVRGARETSGGFYWEKG